MAVQHDVTPHYAHGLVGTPYVCIARVVVEVGGLVDACGTGKRIGKVTLSLQPFAQFDEAALVGSEIEIVGAMEGMQDIEIVG